jgi:hypothetical protein
MTSNRIVVVLLLVLLSSFSPWANQTKISLRGESKSETTWLEIIAFETAKQFCTSTTSSNCKALTEIDQRKRYFSIEVNGSHQFDFSVQFKHGLPGIACKNKESRCQDPTKLVSAENPMLSKRFDRMRTCIHECFSNSLFKPNTMHLYILRDPREVSISSCFFKYLKLHDENINPNTFSDTLSSCMRENFMKVLLNVKYRELAIEQMLDSNKNKICYEELLLPAHRVMGFRKIVSTLGLYANDAQIESIMNATTAAVLKSGDSSSSSSSPPSPSSPSNSQSRTYDMHDLRVDGGTIPKVRSAGEKCYLDYNINNATLAWIHNAYRAAEGFFPSPCAKYRDLYHAVRLSAY